MESSSFADDGSPEVTITSGAQFFSESERSYFREKKLYISLPQLILHSIIYLSLKSPGSSNCGWKDDRSWKARLTVFLGNINKGLEFCVVFLNKRVRRILLQIKV